MAGRWMAVIVLVPGVYLYAAIVSYEGNSFPDEVGWYVGQNWCNTEEWVDAGRFYQDVEFCEGYDPPEGQQSSYRRSLADFIGADRFFVEWRVQTTGDRSELPFTAPAAFVVYNGGSVSYHFTIADNQLRFIRDNRLPVLYPEITPGFAHTYRLELYDDVLYALYIDGDVVDAGVPEGPYPSVEPEVIFRAKAQFVESTTIWDYIRWGDIPVDGSGDFDNDGDRDLFDFYFVHECLTNRRPGINGGPDEYSGPGCRFADFDDDTDVDLRDFALFQNSFTGGEP